MCRVIIDDVFVIMKERSNNHYAQPQRLDRSKFGQRPSGKSVLRNHLGDDAIIFRVIGRRRQREMKIVILGLCQSAINRPSAVGMRRLRPLAIDDESYKPH